MWLMLLAAGWYGKPAAPVRCDVSNIFSGVSVDAACGWVGQPPINGRLPYVRDMASMNSASLLDRAAMFYKNNKAYT